MATVTTRTRGNPLFLARARSPASVISYRKFRRLMDEIELRERLIVICKSHHSSLIMLRGASNVRKLHMLGPNINMWNISFSFIHISNSSRRNFYLIEKAFLSQNWQL
ncbi:hypothetical protein L1987_56241 [Smallanthus sonchifolius]|uniref:Uncharacterized protein n=1 Tax=Smallanthus sonchifolius TaxID=185202 RepID=A0ACB9ECB6_9ASTR|nr:hypothetical protein L1987_56241 [Smallanthus sonchifolius]